MKILLVAIAMALAFGDDLEFYWRAYIGPCATDLECSILHQEEIDLSTPSPSVSEAFESARLLCEMFPPSGCDHE